MGSSACKTYQKTTSKHPYHIFLAPCQYASGNEEKVAQNISSLDEIITVKDTLKHCFLFKKFTKNQPRAPSYIVEGILCTHNYGDAEQDSRRMPIQNTTPL